MDYDSWKTTPDLEADHCPYCYTSLDDAAVVPAELEDGEDLLDCPNCGALIPPGMALSASEARADWEADQADAKYDERIDREW